MLGSVALNSLSSSLLGANIELQSAKSASSRLDVNSSTIRCSSRKPVFIPKLEPFNKTRTAFDRILEDRPLIERTEKELADYCCVLEGDDSYNCWQAYFDLKELEKVAPKEEVERLILQDGVDSLIHRVHGFLDIYKQPKMARKESAKPVNVEQEEARRCPIPDGLPKTKEELEEEEEARMPDSPFTRLLRTKGTYPPWNTPGPEFLY